MGVFVISGLMETVIGALFRTGLEVVISIDFSEISSLRLVVILILCIFPTEGIYPCLKFFMVKVLGVPERQEVAEFGAQTSRVSRLMEAGSESV